MSGAGDDARDAIIAGLRDTASRWVPELFPNGRKQHDEWRLANIQGDPPRNSGSCVIALKGDYAGSWRDFDGDQHGGPLSTVEHATGLSGAALLARAAELANRPIDQQARPRRKGKSRQPRDMTRDVAAILKQVLPLAGTPAEAYLRGRGLTPPTGSDLRFHPKLTYRMTGERYPAMIGVVWAPNGKPASVHRTYLQADPVHPERFGKASIEKPRMLLGKLEGGAVRLAPLTGAGLLGLSEGIETGLAAMTACPELPVWATLSTSGMSGVQLPDEARRILILADHDRSGAGMRAAEAAAHRLRAEGRQVSIALPPQRGDDFNDLLLRDGVEAIRHVIQLVLDAETNRRAASPIKLGRHLPIGFVEPSAKLSNLRADRGDLTAALTDAWALLRASNCCHWLFRFAGKLSWITPDDEGRPVISPLTAEGLRYMLARLAVWQTLEHGRLKPAPPPEILLRALLATPDPNLPVLTGIVTTPVFSRSGRLLAEPGYHAEARVLYHPAPGFALPPISNRPTAEQVAAARRLLLEDLLGDFPFTTEAERAHAVALLLLGFLRPMIDGPTPLHLIEKPAPGTGATLMVDAVALILTGSRVSVMTEGDNDDEWRKRLTAKLRQAPVIVLIDNLKRELDSSALAAALTASVWEDRVLGASEMVQVSTRCIWVATANNPQLSLEIMRRIARIRLDAVMDRPAQRDGFRHPDLISWVRANRARLVAACLTLCRAWIAAGKPLGHRRIGSYEAWAQTLGGVLEVVGIAGFLGNLDEVLATTDAETEAWQRFLTVWWHRFGSTRIGIVSLYDIAVSIEPPLPLGEGNDRSQRTRLGKALMRMRNRVFRLETQAVRLEAHGTYQGAQQWRLAPPPPATPTGQAAAPVNVVNVGEHGSTDVHEEICSENSGLQESRERRERLFQPHARAGAPTREGAETGSPCSPPSPSPGFPPPAAGEHRGERPAACSPLTDPPAWLDEES